MLAEVNINVNQAEVQKFGLVWGDDPEETGIQLFGSPSTLTRSNYMGQTQGTGRLLTSKKYGFSAGPVSIPSADSYSILEDQTLNVPAPGVLANDLLGLSSSIVVTAQPVNGTLSLQQNGAFVYVPKKDFFGVDQFWYALKNTLGTTKSVPVTINIQSVFDQPIILVPDQLIFPELSPITFTAKVFSPDVPDGQHAFILENAPEGAKIGVFSGDFTWTPTEKQGPKSHTFTIVATRSSDPNKVFRKTITLNITEVNLPPSIGPLPRLSAARETTLRRQLTATDPDEPAQVLTYTLEGNIPNGLSISHSGEVYWYPRLSQPLGIVEVTVRVRDALGLSATAPLKIKVMEIPSLSAQVNFLDLDVAYTDPITLVITDAYYQTIAGMQDVTLNEDGEFSVKLPGANLYDISIKEGTWLRKTIRVDAQEGDVTGIVWNLINGDCNGDNYIGTDDYLILNRSFGLRVGDPGFDPRADLDKDGLVGTDDYLILNKSFDLEGDL